MSDSFTLTLTGNSSVLEAEYFPPIELNSNKNYVLGLVELLTFNSIPNIDKGNNKFYVGNQVIDIPTGSYEIKDIESYIQNSIEIGTVISIKPNNNTLRSVVKSNLPINFKPIDSIGKLLGFTSQHLAPHRAHTSDLPVAILKVNSVRIECNITSGAYINNQKVHTINEFFPSVPPGYKIVEVPAHVIYLPITTKTIHNIQLRIVDQDSDLINFRGETITIRLHIKSLLWESFTIKELFLVETIKVSQHARVRSV